jgi:ABC-type uncharacterized transport system permease subunit
MTLVAHLSAAALYAIAGLSGAAGQSLRRALPWLLLAGALTHTVGFFGFHLQNPPVPLDNTAAALSLIGWLVATSYLLSLGLARTAPVGLWVGLGAAVLTLAAAIGLRLGAPPVPGADSGAWSHAHVFLSTAGFALLGLSAVSGAAYIAKERALKRKRASRFELPSLESLDRLEHVTLSLGFPLLTLGVLSGYAWVLSHGGDPWSRHANFLLLAWVTFLLPLSLRVLRHERGLRVSRGVVIGFVILAFCYLGVRVFGGAA